MFCLADFSLTRRDAFFFVAPACCSNSAGSDSDSPMVWGFPVECMDSMDQYQIGYYLYIYILNILSIYIYIIHIWMCWKMLKDVEIKASRFFDVFWCTAIDHNRSFEASTALPSIGSALHASGKLGAHGDQIWDVKRFCCQAGAAGLFLSFLFAVKDFPC